MDPWLMGTCFEGGWGLKYNNPHSFDEIKSCTHLWISHFHSDHFHIPTLSEILRLNPGITVYGNYSFNFKMDEALKGLGFKNVVSFAERQWYQVSQSLDIMRYPATGIDNMLVIKTKDHTVLNFNDCNLPMAARKSLAQKTGHIDIMLCNFNHANKLLDYPLPESAEIRKNLCENFVETYKPFEPKYVVPFASYHYYRAEESLAQNEALIELKDLVPLDKKIIPLQIGHTLEILKNPSGFLISYTKEHPELNHFTIKEHERSYSIEELQEAYSLYRQKIKKGFPLFFRLLPAIDIHISDLDKNVSLRIKKTNLISNSSSQTHIAAHSEALHQWWSKPQGTDDFLIGAHFELTDKPVPLKWQFLLGLMVENKVDMVSLFKMAFSASGWRFLYNRREEIWAIITKSNFTILGRK